MISDLEFRAYKSPGSANRTTLDNSGFRDPGSAAAEKSHLSDPFENH